MSTGLLPRNSASQIADFDSITTRNLTVNNVATVRTLIATNLTFSSATVENLNVTNTTTTKELTLSATSSGTITNNTSGAGAVLTLPTTTTTLLGTGTIDTVSNKTINSASNTITITSGALSAVNINSIIDQPLLVSSSPTFLGALTINSPDLSTTMTLAGGNTPTSNRIIYNNGTFNHTTTYPTLSANRTATFPDATGAIVLDSATQTLTGKTINSASNTILISGTNINSLVDQDVRATANPTFGRIVAVTTASELRSGTLFSFGTRGLIITTSGGTSGFYTDLRANQTADRTIILPNASTTLVGTTDTATLSNKTLTAPVMSTIVNTGTLTLPTSTDTLVGRATTDTLSNKSLIFPTTGGTPATLDFYETGTFSLNYTGAGTATQSVYFSRIGNIVNLIVNAVNTAFVGAVPFTANSQFPTRLLPVSANVTAYMVAYSNGTTVATPGLAQLTSINEFSIFTSNLGGNFGGPGNVGFFQFTMTYNRA